MDFEKLCMIQIISVTFRKLPGKGFTLTSSTMRHCELIRSFIVTFYSALTSTVVDNTIVIGQV